jgi:hypothetical protein
MVETVNQHVPYSTNHNGRTQATRTSMTEKLNQNLVSRPKKPPFEEFNILISGLFSVALAGLCWILAAQPVHAHPIPDGVIYRGIQVIVWSQRIEVRYQLGLSDNMIQQQLRSALPQNNDVPDEPGTAIRKYRDVMFPKLPEKLSVTINHQPQELTRRRADIIRQHHIQIELVYRIDFAAPPEPAYFLLIDDNFQGIPGYHLAAIRSRGLVDIPEATAVPVLSRLSRDPQTEEDLRILSTPVRRIEAMIAAIPDALSSDDAPSEVTSESASTPQVGEREPPAPVPGPVGERPIPRAGGEQNRGLIWPAVGCFLMVVALVWMVFLARRS